MCAYTHLYAFDTHSNTSLPCRTHPPPSPYHATPDRHEAIYHDVTTCVVDTRLRPSHEPPKHHNIISNHIQPTTHVDTRKLYKNYMPEPSTSSITVFTLACVVVMITSPTAERGAVDTKARLPTPILCTYIFASLL